MNERTEKVKNHLRENRTAYFVGGSCLIAGGVIGALVMSRRPEVQYVTDAYNLKLWPPTTTVIEFVERSNPSKPVHLVGTQKYWDSIHAAARDTGHSVSDISKNVNGLRETVKGDVFELVKVDG